MADIKPILSAIGTTKGKINSLPVENGQLIFIQDARSIALDFNGKRVFYDQIVSIQTEEERTSLLAPVNGLYYFVLETAVLWIYNDGWIQITYPPNQIVSIVDTLPPLGHAEKLYVDKREQRTCIWDNETSTYIPVGSYYSFINDEEIKNLFRAV